MTDIVLSTAGRSHIGPLNKGAVKAVRETVVDEAGLRLLNKQVSLYFIGRMRGKSFKLRKIWYAERVDMYQIAYFFCELRTETKSSAFSSRYDKVSHLNAIKIRTVNL